MAGRVIYFVRSWPRLSQTFILNEVLALERRGVALSIVSLVRSGEGLVQPRTADVRAPVLYLEDALRRGRRSRLRSHVDVLARRPLRYGRALAFALSRPGLADGYGRSSVGGCFDQAVRVVRAIDRLPTDEGPLDHVHAHFAHEPALVALFVSRLTGIPFSFTAHARDLFQLPEAALVARAAEATDVVTCCDANARYLRAALPPEHAGRVRVVRHGVDLGRSRPRVRRTRSAPVIVSVARLVPKKGFDDLLAALAVVARTGARFRLDVHGEGPLLEDLRSRARDLGLEDRIRWMGAGTTERIFTALERADLFALTPVEPPDRDRDGIPNAIVEAMATGLPVVTTSAGGIGELVRDDANGRLLPPGDVPGIAAAIAGLLGDPGERRRLGIEARRTVEQGYDVERAASQLERLFRSRTHGTLPTPAAAVADL